MGIQTSIICDLCREPVRENVGPAAYFVVGDRPTYDTLHLSLQPTESKDGKTGEGEAEFRAIFHPKCARRFAQRLAEELNVEIRPKFSVADLGVKGSISYPFDGSAAGRQVRGSTSCP